MKDNENRCEKTHCQSVVCIQHGIKKVLWVTKPLAITTIKITKGGEGGYPGATNFRMWVQGPPYARCVWGGGGVSKGGGETFGGLTLFNTATYQELLDSNHSKAHNFKREDAN